VSDSAYTCCDSPDPAILEKNGRLFCRSCRSYLDKPGDGARPAASEFSSSGASLTLRGEKPDIAAAGESPPKADRAGAGR